ncbi:unnamed protein product [Haemonchus placei]|uniref:Dynein light chain n=1 Tax=Haemonchus placei TaxID=6290 RepID=A0A0N4VUK3_HAEPC|nr:unnamed protein product [Haemonchus placei]
MNFASRRKMSARRRESRRWRDPLEKALRPENILLKETNASKAKASDAILLLGRAIEECGIENEIATFLKKKFDEKHGKINIAESRERFNEMVPRKPHFSL